MKERGNYNKERKAPIVPHKGAKQKQKTLLKELGIMNELSYLAGQLTPIENDLCFKYSDNPEKLAEVLKTTCINILPIGVDYYFDDDTETRPLIRIVIIRNKKEISFRFGMSIADKKIIFCPRTAYAPKSKTRADIKKNLLYSILACIRFDFHLPPIFSDFCAEYGYNEDSIKGRALFERALKHSNKLHSIFAEKEIETFPS